MVEFFLFFFLAYALQSIWLVYVCVDLHFSPPQRLHCLTLVKFDYFVIVNFKANQGVFIYIYMCGVCVGGL